MNSKKLDTASISGAERLEAARKLLVELKAAYKSLPAPHRGAVRQILTDIDHCPCKYPIRIPA
jgi:hypothetical protein